MSDLYSCDDKDSLIAFLYDEVDPPARQRISDHLRTCHACADELDSLSNVRVELAAWVPPAAELGFTVARTTETAPVAVSQPWWSTVPVWAQAAAAVLVLAVSAGVANIQVRSGPEGWVVTTGWMSPERASTPAADESWKPALAVLESQLRGELRATRATSAQPAAITAQTSSDEPVAKQVQTMLAASEQRQRQELALRLTQLTRDLDVQRRADLVRIEQGFGQFEGRTGAEFARQRQMLNYVMRVSGPPQQ